MNNWKALVEEKPTKFKRKIDKYRFCKKNKLGNGKFGSHIYDEKTNRCINCNHFNKSAKNDEIEEYKETTNEAK